WWAGPADREADGCALGPGWERAGGVCGAECIVSGGQCHGACGQVAVVPECDVDGPVIAGWLAEFSGAIEWVDDPDPVCLGAGGIVGGFFAQHGIVRVVGA